MNKWELHEFTVDPCDPNSPKDKHHDYTLVFDGVVVAVEEKPMSVIEARRMVRALNNMNTRSGILK